jgi:hypothetical protein
MFFTQMRIEKRLVGKSLGTKMTNKNLLAIFQKDAVLDQKMFVQIVLKQN